MTDEISIDTIHEDIAVSSDAPITFDPDQQAAIDAGCDVERRFVAITGPAGTGKTRLIKEIYQRLVAAGYTGTISAPTGKAAKRVTESTGIQASTNHRLLGYGMPLEIEAENEKTGKTEIVQVSTGPRYNRSSPFPFDFLISDEYAMVNETIHAELMAAIKPGGRIIVLGDVNQLKPIEDTNFRASARDKPQKPSPFQRALAQPNSIHLRTIHRQSEGSGIAANCAEILARRIPRTKPDFTVTFSDNPVKILSEKFFDWQEQGIDFTRPECQIISPTNKTWVGVDRLNATIQAMVFERREQYLELPRHNKRDYKTGKIIEFDPIRVQIGTKVVYTANTYDLNDENRSSVFNGEVGVVVALEEDESVTVDFGDRVLTIPPLIVTVKDDGRAVEADPRKNLALAYCLTTHKCQGSEFRTVLYLLNKSSQYVQSRSNFYTACSRARELCFLITDQVSMTKSVMWDG